jgi:asparagine synthase (glutamine-hydrolysing)
VKVLIDGQGADEVMAGYSKHIPWYLQEIMRTRPSAFIAEYKALKKNQACFSWGLRNFLAALIPTPVPGILEKREAKRIMHHPDIDPAFRNEYFDRPSLFKPLVLKLNDILYFDTCQFGLEELLRYADRNSMAHGLELRLPFLSHDLVEFLFSLPAQFKIHHGWTKWILRRTMDDILPKDIVWRKEKVGFEPPQKEWMNTDGMMARIREAKKILVDEKILVPAVLNKKIQPQDAHAAENNEWRWLVAAAFVSKDLFA